MRFIGISFCGANCRDEANESYHKYECGITDVIHKAQIGGWALAYRALTSKPLEFFMKDKEKWLDRNEMLGSKDNDQEVNKS